MKKSMHYWRIHARVAKRLLADMGRYEREIISNDTLQQTSLFAWFVNKVANDADRLYQDENYYDNRPETFKYSRVEPEYLAA